MKKIIILLMLLITTYSSESYSQDSENNIFKKNSPEYIYSYVQENFNWIKIGNYDYHVIYVLLKYEEGKTEKLYNLLKKYENEASFRLIFYGGNDKDSINLSAYLSTFNTKDALEKTMSGQYVFPDVMKNPILIESYNINQSKIINDLLPMYEINNLLFQTPNFLYKVDNTIKFIYGYPNAEFLEKMIEEAEWE